MSHKRFTLQSDCTIKRWQEEAVHMVSRKERHWRKLWRRNLRDFSQYFRPWEASQGPPELWHTSQPAAAVCLLFVLKARGKMTPSSIYFCFLSLVVHICTLPAICIHALLVNVSSMYSFYIPLSLLSWQPLSVRSILKYHVFLNIWSVWFIMFLKHITLTFCDVQTIRVRLIM